MQPARGYVTFFNIISVMCYFGLKTASLLGLVFQLVRWRRRILFIGLS